MGMALFVQGQGGEAFPGPLVDDVSFVKCLACSASHWWPIDQSSHCGQRVRGRLWLERIYDPLADGELYHISCSEAS